MASKKEPQEEEVTKPPKKKAGLLKWIILAVLVLVLGAGGYVGWSHFAQSSKPSHTTPKITKEIVYELDTFLVNLSDPGGRRYLKVNIKLRLDNQKVVKELNDRKDQLRDRILMLLSSKRFDDIATLAGKMALKQEIMSRLNSILKEGRVEQVYFTEFLVQ